MNQVELQHIAQGYQEKNIGDEIRDLIILLSKKLPTIFITMAVVMAMVLLFIWTTTPLFSSSVQLLIDPRQRQTVENEITPTGLGSSAAGADTWLMESQVEIMNSRQVLDELINSEALTEDNEFAGASSASFLTTVKNLVKLVVYGPQTSYWNENSPYDKAILKLRKRLIVERLRNTYVISVTAHSKDPEKAARLANRIAEIYISKTNSAASETTLETAQSLDSKLEELRTIASKSAQTVEDYRRVNGLIDTNSTLLIEQRLSELNSELSQARTSTSAALARKNQVLAALQSGSELAVNVSQIAESSVLANLQTQLAQLESQEAELDLVYLSSHPRMVRINGRKAALKVSIQNEYSRILNRLDADYQTEKQKSQALDNEVSRLEAKMATSNSSTVKLRALELEATANRNIYESFLRRSKEAREQIDIPRSTARVISVAKAASKPSHPKVLLLLIAGLAFGCILGILVALIGSVFRRKKNAPQPARELNENSADIRNIETTGLSVAEVARREAYLSSIRQPATKNPDLGY